MEDKTNDESKKTSTHKYYRYLVLRLITTAWSYSVCSEESTRLRSAGG